MFSNDKADVMYICLSSSVKCDGTPGKFVSENIRLLAASSAKWNDHYLQQQHVHCINSPKSELGKVSMVAMLGWSWSSDDGWAVW